MHDDLAQMAADWIAYTARHHPKTGDMRDVLEGGLNSEDHPEQVLISLLVADPRTALKFIEHILCQTTDPWILENVGAGPLEDLLVGGDPSIISSIEAFPSRYPHAREALSHVWTKDLPEQSKEALRRALLQ
jgi:hypothetical protein